MKFENTPRFLKSNARVQKRSGSETNAPISKSFKLHIQSLSKNYKINEFQMLGK